MWLEVSQAAGDSAWWVPPVSPHGLQPEGSLCHRPVSRDLQAVLALSFFYLAIFLQKYLPLHDSHRCIY